MKKSINNFSRMLYAGLLCSGLMLTGCYDDTAILESLKNHQEQIDELRALCSRYNTSIEALQKVVSALQEKDYVISVNPVRQGDVIVGYTIIFEKGGPVTIYNGADGIDGADGKDAYVPVIAMKQWNDGMWYWTIDGDWLLDSKGKMIKAVGTDGEDGSDGTDGENGTTPVLKIEDGYWYISYDGGNTYEAEPVGQATGDAGYSMFEEVTYDEEYVYVIMADGTTLTLPRSSQDESAVTYFGGGVSMSVTSRDITHKSAVFYGKIQLADNYSADSFGIAYSTSEALCAANATFVPITDLNEEDYSIQISTFIPGRTYYYASYVNIGDFYVYGEIQSFTTVIPTFSGCTDLSLGGTANCYIVRETGGYHFPTVKGNSYDYLNSVQSAEVLWESFGTDVAPNEGDLIKSVYYQDDCIVFQTADAFKRGNAVIAAKDASGNILWSWHIWFGGVPHSNLGSAGSVTKGLRYQWGRKDPFLGRYAIYYPEYGVEYWYEAESTITWPYPVDSDANVGTIEYATAHPTTFIRGNDMNGDWHYTGDETTDNTRWTTFDKPKSIYDPCPAGWRVQDSNIWLQYSYIEWDIEYLMFNDVSYPATYLRYRDDNGDTYGEAEGGYYGSVSHTKLDTGADALYFSVGIKNYRDYYLYRDFNVVALSHDASTYIRCFRDYSDHN